MTRKRCRRRVVIPTPPRGLRPKLSSGQVTDLAVNHLQLLDDISRGRATQDTLWQAVGGVLTWWRAAELMQLGVEEMRPQLELVTRVVERFSRTGKVGFSGVEYQVAKRGVNVMDALAETVDQLTASAAADWSENEVNRMAKR